MLNDMTITGQNDGTPGIMGLQAERNLAQELTQLADSLKTVSTDLQQRNETSLRWEDQPALTEQINQIIRIMKNNSDSELVQEELDAMKLVEKKEISIPDLNQLINKLKDRAEEQRELISEITPRFKGIVQEFQEINKNAPGENTAEVDRELNAILQRIDRLG